MNNFSGIGRITKELELRKTPTGKSVLSFSIAINRRYDKDTTDFINCVAWERTAEFIDMYLGKGVMVGIEGELQNKRYTDRDGNQRTTYEVLVMNVTPIEWKNKEESYEVTSQPKPTRSPQTKPDDDLVLDITSDDLPF